MKKKIWQRPYFTFNVAAVVLFLTYMIWRWEHPPVRFPDIVLGVLVLFWLIANGK
jgi:hypothetical protein